jgi:dihydroneopterin aldolase
MPGKVTAYRMRLNGIRFRGRHGASRAERDLPQDFVADLDLELPSSAIPKTDSKKAVFDYGKIADAVVEVGTTRSYRLLETLASELVARIFEVSPAARVTVSVTKFGPPTSASVDRASIELTAERT